ncbi:MAG: hypothetical protein AAF518_22535, partial [Spirochaetota bacterium]
GGKISDAIEIFTRINTKGSTLTKDWMLSALTSDEGTDFNLNDNIKDLKQDLRSYGFEYLKRDTVIQCIQNSFGHIYFDTKIEDLARRNDFIDTVDKALKSIYKAVRFLYEELLVVTPKLLPYNNQLIFLTEFFNYFDNPSEQQKNDLKKWFWQTSYANYFTIYSLSKIREAYKLFQGYLLGKSHIILYNDKPNQPFTVASFPNKLAYKGVRSKTLTLFLLNYANQFEKAITVLGDSQALNNIYLYPTDNSAEGVISLLDTDENLELLFLVTNKRAPKNLEIALTEDLYQDDLQKFFLTRDMIGKNKKEVLQIRKELIQKEEKKFVESLGLQYE